MREQGRYYSQEGKFSYAEVELDKPSTLGIHIPASRIYGSGSLRPRKLCLWFLVGGLGCWGLGLNSSQLRSSDIQVWEGGREFETARTRVMLDGQYLADLGSCIFSSSYPPPFYVVVIGVLLLSSSCYCC